MPKKKRPTQTTHSTHTGQALRRKPKPAKGAEQNRFIQLAALVILALAVIGIIWAVVANQKPADTKGYPAMTIDKNKHYTATVKMAKGGEVVIQLYADKAPLTVNSFVYLARKGFYNGVTFHRVLQDFMAQGGDPTGTGGGGPGYEFKNEDSDLTFDKEGVVAMANSGRDTNGSQFFITFTPQQRLNGSYTIFGQVTSGMDVVKAIRLRDPDQSPNYPGDAIQTITIAEK